MRIAEPGGDELLGKPRYSAFISYNHRDRGWATWLHRGIERYRVPKRLQGREASFGPIGERLPPVFRDRDELAASGDLAASVRAALEASATLVVLCSPNAARSRWVNQEIDAFIDAGREDRIRLIIVEGEPHSADPETECLPPALGRLRAEPLAADARKGQDGPADARLKIIAGILDLPFDELRQREAQRRARRLTVIAAAAIAGLVLTSALAILAWVSRNEAVRQREIAEARTLTAERTLDFVKSMFRVSDPSEARGETITAREVVDRGTARLETGLRDQPAVRADLSVTLAEVYRALGLFERSARLVRASLSIPHGDADIRVRQLATQAETRADLGDYAGALAGFRRARAAGGEGMSAALRSRLLVGIGQAQSALGDTAAADRTMREALRRDLARGAVARGDVALDNEVLGINAFYAGQPERARTLIERALALRLDLEGANSPSVNDNRNTLAAIAFSRGDLAVAEQLFRANLATDERVLGRDHPDVAATLNNVARALLDQRRFAAAAPLIARAIAINEKAGRAEHDDMAFLYSNLAIARRHLGDTAAAELLFRRALEIARRHDHRILGPALADLAELLCATGRTGDGLALLPEAASATARDYPDDPWRTAWVEGTRGSCLVHSGARREGLVLLERSTLAIAARWPAATLFGGDAARRLAAARAGVPKAGGAR